MTREECAAAAPALAQKLADRQELRILRNLIAMADDELPRDVIAAYLDLERLALASSPEQLRPQLLAWVQHQAGAAD